MGKRPKGIRIDSGDLIAQAFTGEQWFHSRPSAGAYATVSSAASNLAPSNPALAARVKDSAAEWAVPEQGPVPLAMLTTSASGLDPHLPPEAIRYQLPRVAAARGLPVQTVEHLLQAHIEQPWVGPPVVNVLNLNRALAQLTP